MPNKKTLSAVAFLILGAFLNKRAPSRRETEKSEVQAAKNSPLLQRQGKFSPDRSIASVEAKEEVNEPSVGDQVKILLRRRANQLEKPEAARRLLLHFQKALVEKIFSPEQGFPTDPYKQAVEDLCDENFPAACAYASQWSRANFEEKDRLPNGNRKLRTPDEYLLYQARHCIDDMPGCGTVEADLLSRNDMESIENLKTILRYNCQNGFINSCEELTESSGFDLAESPVDLLELTDIRLKLCHLYKLEMCLALIQYSDLSPTNPLVAEALEQLESECEKGNAKACSYARNPFEPTARYPRVLEMPFSY